MRKPLSLSALLTAAILTACGTPGIPSNNEQASRPTPNLNVNLDPQVINGTPSVLGARPYQVALLQNGRQFCGGTIIAADWILTAAHCVQGQSASSVSIRAGSLSATSGGVTRSVSTIRVHPSYRDVTTGYDIAVMKLSSPLTFSSTIQAAALPTQAFAATAAAPGTSHWISGWGMTRSGDTSSASTVLREALLPAAASSVCQSGLGKTITGTMLCAQVNSQQQTGCHGDSGGPFASMHNGKFFVFGAVSWGTSQYCLNGPMVFAKVGELQPWITTNSGVQPQDGSGGTPTDPTPTDPTPTPGPQTYSGSLSSGSYAFQPGSTGIAYSAGTITATLVGPTTSDFDLYLQKRNTDGTWSYVVKQATSATTERATYTATAGTYRWIVSSYTGSGSYTLTVNR